MDAVDQKILNNYLGLIEKLTPAMKSNLIERLKESMMSTKKPKSQMEDAFGAWHSGESAEELIQSIRSSRKTNRQIEEI